MMDRIDLHTHTSYSDGSLTPYELAKTAHEKNIRAIAMTDHDTIGGLLECSKACDAFGVEFVSGIEISAYYNLTEIHVLGLNFDLDSDVLKNNLPDMNTARRERNVEMIKKLNLAGVKIKLDNIIEYVNGVEVSVTRMHFARAIVEAGYCKTNEEAFKKYLTPGCKTYVNREIFSHKKAIELIRDAGGVSILAHPLRYRLSLIEMKEIIKNLALAGLNGLECYYSSHSEFDQTELLKIAEKNHLIPSGGSDFHGENKNGVELGTGYGKLFVPYKVLEDLKQFNNSARFANNRI